MTVFAHIRVCKTPNSYIMYDFATKKFSEYQEPKTINKALIITIGVLTFLGVMPAKDYSTKHYIEETGYHIKPLIQTPNMGKVILIYLGSAVVLMIVMYYLFGKQAESGKLLQANFTDLELLKKYCHEDRKENAKSLPKHTGLVIPLFILAALAMDILLLCMFISGTSLYYFIADSFFFIFWTALWEYLLWIGIARKLVTHKYNLEF
ncbi:hypothetical protein [Bombilactobacillus thymidiniphilus]|uniref:Uncharacterized protein n=1 Tax=Bombilactobacillus thymidiniphilus TaxID=2923363 RepID=A0ABY4PBN5_9LACO|nr:hypothetical protein [Bombilactobacillus thymidiniphilus]UQS83188.1 hypothetical protein MOO47_05220 [Bombilactobacillus thymidiniphilus]